MLEATGMTLLLSQICTEIHEMGLTSCRQKLCSIIHQNSEKMRAEFINQVMYVPTSVFVFLDETCNVWLPKLTLSCTTLVTQFSYFMIDLCNYNMYSCICMYAHTHVLVMCTLIDQCESK